MTDMVVYGSAIVLSLITVYLSLRWLWWTSPWRCSADFLFAWIMAGMIIFVIWILAWVGVRAYNGQIPQSYKIIIVTATPSEQ